MSRRDRDDQPARAAHQAGDEARAARLKAALQANIARRKAQARARAGQARTPGQEQENARDD